MTLINYYGGSQFNLITSIFPNHEWLLWRFANSPDGFWDDIKNQRKFMEYVGKQLKIKDFSDFYQVNRQTIIGYGGSGILRKYSSLIELFQTIFPEFSWDKFKFKYVPWGYRNSLLKDVEEQKDFVKYLEKKLGIKETSDWYLITHDQIKNFVSVNISDVMLIVKKYYPDLNMKYFKLGNTLGSKKSQYTLKSMLQIIFENYEIVEEYRHTDLENLELDYYIPELKLAFEYQVTRYH